MDQRSAPRVEVQAAATLRCADREITGRLGNASINGLFVMIEQPIPTGTAVEIRLELPANHGRSTIECRGIVRHYTSGGVGIHIETLKPDTFLHWRKLITQAIDREKLPRNDSTREPASTGFWT